MAVFSAKSWALALMGAFVLASLAIAARTVLEPSPPAAAPQPAPPPASPSAIRSPFAPVADGAATALAGVRVIGVRLAADPARSGAVLVLPDGAQRAFGVGQEVLPGVRLARVDAGGVTFATSAGDQRVPAETPNMAPAPSPRG